MIAEVDCGWVPYFKEQIDNNYQRLDAGRATSRSTTLPSEYVERNFHFTFITDTFGVRNRHDVGVDTCSGRATTRTSAPTGRTRGGRSRPRSRAFPPPSASRSSPATRPRLYRFGH